MIKIFILLILLFGVSVASEMKEIGYGTIPFFEVESYEKLDLNKDGVYDAVILASRNNLYLINTGGVKNIYGFPSIIQKVSNIDWNKDGFKNEIIVVADKIYILSDKGNILYEINDTGYDVCSIDFDNDGYENEIVLGKGRKVVIYGKDKKFFEREIGITRVEVSCFRNKFIAFSANILEVYEGKSQKLFKQLENGKIFDAIFIDLDKDKKYNDIAVLLSNGYVYVYKDYSKELPRKYISLNTKCYLKIFPYDIDYDGYEEDFGIINIDLYLITAEKEKIPFGIFASCPDSFDLIDLDGDKILDDIVLGKKGDKGYIAVMNSGKEVYKFKFKITVNRKEEEISSERYNKTAADFIFSLDLDGDRIIGEFIVLNLLEGKYYILKPLVIDKTRKREREIILLANSIDYKLSEKFRKYITDKGHRLIHVTANNFSAYKSERYIIILGGHKAYEGVGDIVKTLLKTLPVYLYEDYIREIERMYEVIKLKDVYSKGQVIYIIAGRDRYKTREAAELYVEEIIREFEKI